MDYPSVEQGCLQVLSTLILLQTLLHLLLPSTMFVAVIMTHFFFGNVAWQSKSQLVSTQPI
jgi:hypothetical protein